MIDISKCWRYYLHPAEINPDPPGYFHTEPPTFEPTYYDWPVYAPDPPWPQDLRLRFTSFVHR
jgi:hypothetical protein